MCVVLLVADSDNYMYIFGVVQQYALCIENNALSCSALLVVSYDLREKRNGTLKRLRNTMNQ